jgi:hypothetical protein
MTTQHKLMLGITCVSLNLALWAYVLVNAAPALDGLFVFRAMIR